MKTVADYLRYAKKGIKLYSPIFGECEFDHVSPSDSIYVRYKDTQIEFNKYGQFSLNNSDGECLLFPSKEVRDWSSYQLPAPHDFKPFDKVVVRDEGTWHIDFFTYYAPTNEYPYRCMANNWRHCLPFNEETVKLIGLREKKLLNK
jgi:hypothetical protein